MIEGCKLRNRREALGLTVQQIADKVGVSRQTVSKWENDTIDHISSEYLLSLARVLKVDLEWILGEEKELQLKESLVAYDSQNYSSEFKDLKDFIINNADTINNMDPDKIKNIYEFIDAYVTKYKQ